MYVQDGKFVKLSYLQNYPINFRMTEPAGDRIYIEYNTYYLLTGCKGRTRKYKPKVFHTARACEGCWENQGLVFPGTARAPS